MAPGSFRSQKTLRSRFSRLAAKLFSIICSIGWKDRLCSTTRASSPTHAIAIALEEKRRIHIWCATTSRDAPIGSLKAALMGFSGFFGFLKADLTTL